MSTGINSARVLMMDAETGLTSTPRLEFIRSTYSLTDEDIDAILGGDTYTPKGHSKVSVQLLRDASSTAEVVPAAPVSTVMPVAAAPTVARALPRPEPTTTPIPTALVDESAPYRAPPRYVRDATPEDLDWTPVAYPLYGLHPAGDDSQQFTRAARATEIVRPGHERHPLGIATGVYTPVSHHDSLREVAAFAGDALVPFGPPMIEGIGAHVLQDFAVVGLRPATIDGAVVTSRLNVSHSNTGDGALLATMVVYLDGVPVGRTARVRGLHVGGNAAVWASEITAMVETSILTQDLVLDLLDACNTHQLDETARKAFTDAGIKVSDVDRTILDVLKAHHTGKRRAMTWGVWSKRLENRALMVASNLTGLSLDPRAARRAVAA